MGQTGSVGLPDTSVRWGLGLTGDLEGQNRHDSPIMVETLNDTARRTVYEQSKRHPFTAVRRWLQ